MNTGHRPCNPISVLGWDSIGVLLTVVKNLTSLSCLDVTPQITVHVGTGHGISDLTNRRVLIKVGPLKTCGGGWAESNLVCPSAHLFLAAPSVACWALPDSRARHRRSAGIDRVKPGQGQQAVAHPVGVTCVGDLFA